MEKTIEIPEGYEARIEGNKIILEPKESEDDRIRKAILELVKQSSHILNPMNQKSMIAWLEKQGEQKLFNNDKYQTVSVKTLDRLYESEKELERLKQNEQKPAWSEEDEIGFRDAMWAIEQARTIAKNENDMGNLWYAENWLKVLKERVQTQTNPAWSGQDNVRFTSTIQVLEFARSLDSYNQYGKKDIRDNLTWLKSLKERYTWKPSDEQMQALANALGLANNCGEDSAYYLRTLHEQLKKLKG